MIHVCPLSRLDQTLASSGAGHLVTLLRADTPFERPASVAHDRHLALLMHDIAAEQPDMVAPSEHHVGQLLTFAARWDRAHAMLIHCYAGISRSTAAAYIVAAALEPDRNETELAQTLRRLSPSATPNPRLIMIADSMLGRDGRMIAAVAAMGRGADAFEGTPFCLPLKAYKRGLA
jgi:predicted protein tyrosine phosphatase